MMPNLRFKNTRPMVHQSAYIAPGAALIGNVVIGSRSSLWFGVVARGDMNEIRIGERTNIQDGSIIHVSSTGQGTYIGDGVTIGHMAVIHACTLEDASFVGIKACVLDGAVVQSGAMVAAGALVTSGKTVLSGELWGGVPARHIRQLNEEETDMIRSIPDSYVELAMAYKTQKQDYSNK